MMNIKALFDGFDAFISWLAKFLLSLAAGLALFGAVVAFGVEMFSERIVIEPVSMPALKDTAAYVPQNFHNRIVEKIERIRAQTRAQALIEQKAVTRVDDLTFKAEGFEFSVVKFLAPIKAAFGRGDKRVTSEISCYRADCALEPHDEDDGLGPLISTEVPRPPSDAPVPAPPKNDTLRLRFTMVIENRGAIRVFSTRISLRNPTFRSEIEAETQKLAEAVMEHLDPVTAASYFYARSKQVESRYDVSHYRGRAVEAAERAFRRSQADLCWTNNLLATIAIDEEDLVGAGVRLDAVPEADRTPGSDCAARLALTRGTERWRHSRIRRFQGLPNEAPAVAVQREAYDHFERAFRSPGASEDTRVSAILQAARVIEILPDGGARAAITFLDSWVDTKHHSLALGRPQLAAALHSEAAQIEKGAGNIDAALGRMWNALQADPGSARPYVQIGTIQLSLAIAEKTAPAEREARLTEADVVLRQALNGGGDADDIEVIRLLADIRIARGHNLEAINELSNALYPLERANYQVRHAELRRIYAHWLFLARRAGKASGRGCDDPLYDLRNMRQQAAGTFASVGKLGDCAGQPTGLPAVRNYEESCASALDGAPLLRCLRVRDGIQE